MDLIKQKSIFMTLVERLANIKIGEITLLKIEQLAVKLGIDEKKLLNLYIKTKNTAYRERFASTPFSERIILLPQCLRSNNCKAKRIDYGYQCASCGKCGINKVIKLSKKLGYKGVYIVSGGSIVNNILKNIKPTACLAVACLHELVLGSILTERLGIVAQGVQLKRDGCIDTLVDWASLNAIIKLGV